LGVPVHTDFQTYSSRYRGTAVGAAVGSAVGVGAGAGSAVGVELGVNVEVGVIISVDVGTGVGDGVEVGGPWFRCDSRPLTLRGPGGYIGPMTLTPDPSDSLNNTWWT